MGYFIWPTPDSKRITSKYGPRNLNIAGSSKYHKGVDVGASTGTKIVAMRSGIVTTVKTGYNGGRGYYVVVKHNEQFETLYQHCSKLLVSANEKVLAGQTIALVGNTGIGSGSHLHFEIHDLKKAKDPVYGNTVDPLKYVKTTDTLANLSDSAVFSELGATTSNAVSSIGKSIIIFIGDSRTVGMKSAVGSSVNIWSCESAKGFKWMKEIGVPNIENKVTSSTGVCILMGINDLTYVKPSEYYNYINECASRWTSKGASVYFVSVNPVSKTGYGSITNQMIETWNQNVRDGLSINVGYIDTYSAIINSFNAPDGLHYDKATYQSIYQIITDSVNQGDSTLYSNSAVIGGSPIQVDYTKLNPYVVTIDRATSAGLDYTKLKEAGVVGAILEAGYLYTEIKTKAAEFKNPRFDVQLKHIVDNNLDYGFFFIARARTKAEAESEIYELSFIVRQHPPKLGVWIKLDLSSKSRVVNDGIIDVYEKRLLRLGLVGKIGFYTTKESLSWFTWEKYQDRWVLWTIDHVEEESSLQQLLNPEFFDVDGK